MKFDAVSMKISGENLVNRRYRRDYLKYLLGENFLCELSELSGE